MEKIPFENNKEPSISKEILMQLQENIEKRIIQKDIMTAYQINAQIANENQDVRLDNFIKIGNKLTFKDGAIVIGKDVEAIAVKGRIFFEYLPDMDYARPAIKLNNQVIARRLNGFVRGGGFFTVELDYSPILVNEGDEIRLNYGELNKKQPTTRGDSLETFLTVEVIKYTK